VRTRSPLRQRRVEIRGRRIRVVPPLLVMKAPPVTVRAAIVPLETRLAGPRLDKDGGRPKSVRSVKSPDEPANQDVSSSCSISTGCRIAS
jgi:hypothetical protein